MPTQPTTPPLPLRDATADTGANHYWRYHRLSELLACKQPVTNSADEDLFIAVHQVCELSFHQMLLDLDRALDALAGLALHDRGGDEACYFLDRVTALYETANRTVAVLGGMRAFAEFRQSLGPSSGFQSAQFRRLEIMSGVREAYWHGGTRDAAGRLHAAEAAFEQRFGAEVQSWFAIYRCHSLRHYFETLVAGAGAPDRRAAIGALLQAPAVGSVLQSLRAYEDCQSRFHAVHLGVAMRQLAAAGVTVGTGGTTFKTYLEKYGREQAPLFPGLAEQAAAPRARAA
jgi:tryptophan 2,3-dioxygenase